MGKILWVCKESFTSLTNFCIPYFNEYKNEAIFIHPTESLLRDTTFVNFKKNNNDIKIHTLDKIAHVYSDNISDKLSKESTNKLQGFEEKYCKKVDWGTLLMSSQIFTTPYHYRYFFKDLTDEEKNYWVLLLFEYMENLVKTSKPDFIFDFDNSEIGRSVLWLVADFFNIPYITIEHTRYNGYLIPNFNLGRKVDDFFIEKFLSIKKADSSFETEVISYRNKSEIANKDYKNNKTLKKNNNSLFKDLKRLGTYEISAIKKMKSKIRFLKSNFRFPFIAHFPSIFFFFLEMVLRERYLLSSLNPFFKNPVEGEKYIYFPLHLVPESSTLIKAPFYPNEESVIAFISKALPLGWKLYIKEHGAMIGERPLKFYKKISRLSNVEFIKLDAHSDPKSWILKSQGVITLTGTSAFESVMLGKPAIVLGTVPFEMINGITKCKSLLALPGIIKKEFVGVSKIDNFESCAKYLQIINEIGEIVEFTFLHNSCYNSLLFKTDLCDKARNQIVKMVEVLKKGVNLSS
ncbi:hypothetical protein SAMN05444411_101768 [Lutibacter oricola]|uniref:Capsule polysaccharide biosynthesis protein n=1 Tax=Lutibacter oricola TaxID=762486 RepID=A0A1H2TQW7_9FLAO|nr:hypothetical protein [Lutibacter oricola]SDW45684.1 hypothetical protein SAMN05444411_101768 [Lutibacter oricola]